VIERRSGVLLHITSLPSRFGIGDLGPEAYRFADFLARAEQRVWQVLPVNPPSPGAGNSPYDSTSAFAFNPLLISPEKMVEMGYLEPDDIDPPPDLPLERVAYPAVAAFKERLFGQAYSRFREKRRPPEFDEFCAESAQWLDDHALFTALLEHFQGRPLAEWPPEVRDRRLEALEPMREKLCDRIEKEKFLQFVFLSQWRSLKEYCNQLQIELMGDVPIYVSYMSSDVWVHPDIFKLDQNRRCISVAGVSPDYFSETGQLWGNPLYRWDVLKKRAYDWWVRRFRHTFMVFDTVRIDHFRGFFAYWEIPAGADTAVHGEWIRGPGMSLFSRLVKEMPAFPVIVEDHGYNPPDLQETMDHFEFPATKILVFGFGKNLTTNPYIPHNYVRNSVVYTTTHDTNTLRGWFEKEASRGDKKRLLRYLGHEVSAEEISWEMIRLAMMSVPHTSMIPVQDLLGLGEEARMNRPATKDGNWEWRLLPDQLDEVEIGKLRDMMELYGRVPERNPIPAG
jgi:4-alpha-glucanotransferase